MTKEVTRIKAGSDEFVIYDSLQVGETIYAGSKSITVEDDKTLETLREGKLPRKGKASE